MEKRHPIDAVRFLPPAHSPLTLASVLSGFAAMLRGGRAARHEVGGWIRSIHSPEQFLLTDSGTSALALALGVAEARGQTPVALPAYCCYDVATAADCADIPFLLYDLDPLTLAPDSASLRAAVQAGAGAVVVAHLYGIPVDLDAVRATIGSGVLIIEDAAQAAGVSYKGRPAGALGQLGVLSFGRGKGTTGGGGGALLVNDASLADAFRLLADGVSDGQRGTVLDYVKLKTQWLFGRPFLYVVPSNLSFLGLGETVYRPPHPPAGISAIAAGTLSRTVALARGEAAARRRNAEAILRAVSGVEGVVPLPGRMPESWTPGWLRFPILIDERRGIDLRALRRFGIERGYPGTLAGLPGFGARRLNPGHAVPGAGQLSIRLATLPTHGQVLPRDIVRMRAALSRSFQGRSQWPAP